MKLKIGLPAIKGYIEVDNYSKALMYIVSQNAPKIPLNKELLGPIDNSLKS